MRTVTRAFATAAATALAAGVLGTGGAYAGEITGTGESLKNDDGTLNGASICAFSGLDDADDDGFGRTQNWGQIPKAVRDEIAMFGAHPGDSCKPGAGGH